MKKNMHENSLDNILKKGDKIPVYNKADDPTKKWLNNSRRRLKENFRSAPVLEKKIQEYFDERTKKGLPWTLEGLHLHLNVTHDTFNKYIGGQHSSLDDDLKEALQTILQTAYMRIKESRVTGVCTTASDRNVDGNWRLLKNMGVLGVNYEDKKYQENKNIEIEVGVDKDED